LQLTLELVESEGGKIFANDFPLKTGQYFGLDLVAAYYDRVRTDTTALIEWAAILRRTYAATSGDQNDVRAAKATFHKTRKQVT
jgi:hypothetical protein